MQTWWEGLKLFQQISFAIAVPSTLILLIFLIMMIIGIDGSDAFGGDGDIDVGGIDTINDEPFSDISGLRILNVRGSLTFLSIGGWMGFILNNYLDWWLSAILCILIGGIAAFLQALAFKASLRLESEGNIDYINSIGRSGVVYLRIPPKRTGRGKVNVIVQGRYVEIDAITDDEEIIATGSDIIVQNVFNETTVIVKKVKEN